MLTLGNRFSMAVLGFSSGLPLVVFQGTIAAWLTDGYVDTKSIGVLSMASLPYVFKFLWAPAIASSSAPVFGSLFAKSQLRSWFMLGLTIIAPIFLIMPFIEPKGAVWLVALLVLLGVFASATQDIAIGAWRIRMTSDEASLSNLVTIEQFAYRSSTFIGGAIALLLAGWIGWSKVWLLLSALFFVCFVLVFFIPEPEPLPDSETPRISFGGNLSPEQRLGLLRPIILVWAGSLLAVLCTMLYILGMAPTTSVRSITFLGLPLVCSLCIGTPIWISIYFRKLAGPDLNISTEANGIIDILYINLLEPFIELTGRLKFSLITFLFFVLFYRYTDGIWGALAYPFYLGDPEVNGGMGFQLHEVSAASKVFGVLATMGGFIVGRLLISGFGLMPTLLLGSILAAVTNLLYADLALGATYAQYFFTTVMAWPLIEPAVWLSNYIAPPDLSNYTTETTRFGPLVLTILAENISVGIASVAFVAHISRYVSPKYSATQYAIFASIYNLIASLSRPFLAELAGEHGFAYVFILTTILGIPGIIAVVIEWTRKARHEYQSITTISV
ncbi:MAG: hypothetical protein KTR25_19320 [Myxococcales bacterium]|nr:hypothetical protein [Myxococcales bacterium]